jgi:hypothetical protein
MSKVCLRCWVATVVGCLVIGGVSRPLLAAEGIRATATLYKDALVVGEPVVIAVTVVNETDHLVFAPGLVRGAPEYDVTLWDVAGQLVNQIESPGCIFHVTLPRVGSYNSQPQKCLKPGETLTHRVTLVLRAGENRKQFLGPGEYRVAITLGWGDELVAPAAIDFAVRELSPRNEAALAVYTPRLGELLEGNWSNPLKKSTIPPPQDPTKLSTVREFEEHASDVAAQLKQDFPNLPYRKYLEYRQLPVVEESREFLAASATYLEEFTESPYQDAILYRRALAYVALEEWAKAAESLAELRTSHADSIYLRQVADVEEEILMKVLGTFDFLVGG